MSCYTYPLSHGTRTDIGLGAAPCRIFIYIDDRREHAPDGREPVGGRPLHDDARADGGRADEVCCEVVCEDAVVEGEVRCALFLLECLCFCIGRSVMNEKRLTR